MASSADFRLCLAPLHGVTGKIFRRAYFNHFQGFDEAMAPFILAVSGSSQKGSHFKDLSDREGESVPLTPQLLGNDAEAFLRTAEILADMGYTEVNWNLGCPYAMVANKARGSGLLPYPARIAEFLDQVCPRISIKLSLKVRLGRESPAEIKGLMPIFNSHPLSRLIIHPRVGTQMYRGMVDLDAFEEAAASSTHEVAYNGDIINLESFEKMRNRFPTINSWMVGRGALANPFLAAELRGTAPASGKLVRLRAFHDELYASYRQELCGPSHALDKMKEVWSYLGPSFHGAEGELRRLQGAKSLDAYDEAVARVFLKGRWRPFYRSDSRLMG
jgi:tRNA-dihydrouridine synthase B